MHSEDRDVTLGTENVMQFLKNDALVHFAIDDLVWFKPTGTKACLRERILGEPILMKVCATSIIIHFNSVLVF